MLSADRIVTRDLRTGLSPLEPLLRGNIITLRCSDSTWLTTLASDLIVRNYEAGRKTLYLHWVDYHKRFWTLDYDSIFTLARKIGIDSRRLALDTYFVRAFSRDNNEVEENWKKIFSFGKFDLIILDSVSELYDPDAGNRAQNQDSQRPMLYSIGKFIQLCIKNDCTGIALDFSPYIHPYLAHTSSIIIDFFVSRHEIVAKLRKHPSLPEETLVIPRDRQYRLWRWL